jgi:hypothetical protein
MTFLTRIRGDVASTPSLVKRTPAVWVPSLLIVASTFWFALGDGSLRGPSGTAFNVFVFPPPIVAVFLAGLLAPRAGYLAGVIVGLIAAVAFGAYVAFGPIPSALTVDEQQGYIIYGLLLSPISGLLLGAFGGLVRRAAVGLLRRVADRPSQGASVVTGWERSAIPRQDNLASRLSELEEAKAAGLISDDEYALRRAKVLDSV